VKEFGSIHPWIEDFSDMWFVIYVNTIGPLSKTRVNNKYIMAIIHHYLKWCEAKFMNEQTSTIVVRFLEKK
jgi:hypothetical protein